MTLETVRVDVLTERAREAGLDGSDRGAVRRLVWRELGSDAVDPEELARPVVRILLNRDGQRVAAPFELDLRKEKGVLAAVTLPDSTAFYRATA